MTYPRRTAIEYLQDILGFCERIEQYTAGLTLDDFLHNQMVQDAVTRNVEIIGEAARQLLEVEPDMPTRFPSIPFRALYGMRNRLIHGYSSMRLNTVFQVAKGDVPALREAVTAALTALAP
jgi:uncharacterized protein with HEPN domain